MTDGAAVNVLDFGAVGDGVADDTVAIQAAIDSIISGEVLYPAGTYMVSSPLVVKTGHHNIGQGKGATILTQAIGANTDIFKTEDFDALTGVGDIMNAPHSFSITAMSIEGNYLSGSWDDPAAVINNTLGTAIKLFGSRYTIDVEVNNIPENALYTEGRGDYGERTDHASFIKLYGRTSGREGIVFRGPGDIVLEQIVFGVIGVLNYSAMANHDIQESLYYPGEPCSGIVLDDDGPYNGHAEIGFAHIYAVAYGYGVVTKGVNRLNAAHLVCENSRGGLHCSDGANGVISILELRANGRQPGGYVGSQNKGLEDLLLDNGQVWGMNITTKVYRYGSSNNSEVPLVDIRGDNNSVKLWCESALDGSAPIEANMLHITGSNNDVDFNAKRIKGHGASPAVVTISGPGNRVKGNVNGVYGSALLLRDDTSNEADNNMVEIVGSGLDSGSTSIISIGTPFQENIKMQVTGNGQTHFSGSAPTVLPRRQKWDISSNDGTITKSTGEYYKANMNMTVGITHTEVFNHDFLYTPDYSQCEYAIRAAADQSGNILETLHIQGTPSDTQILVSYKWAAVANPSQYPVLILHVS
tara:strand:- start:19 stop:1770 length:1752 start_codon:yes stop_codon:yes gene_type:complete